MGAPMRLMLSTYAKENAHISAEKKLLTPADLYDYHSHDFFEMEIVLSGSGTHRINGKSYKLKRGSICLLTPADAHTLRMNEDIWLYNIKFDESVLSERFLYFLMCENTTGQLFIPEKTIQNVTSICEMMISEEKEAREHYMEFLRNMLECLIITLQREMRTESNSKFADRASALRQALVFIHMHFRENPTLVQVAKHTAQSPNYFCEFFKKNIGMSYTEYITRLKINYAKSLLCLENMPITKISYNSGFNSVSAFLRAFTKIEGTTPTKYKKQNKMGLAHLGANENDKN